MSLVTGWSPSSNLLQHAVMAKSLGISRLVSSPYKACRQDKRLIPEESQIYPSPYHTIAGNDLRSEESWHYVLKSPKWLRLYFQCHSAYPSWFSQGQDSPEVCTYWWSLAFWALQALQQLTGNSLQVIQSMLFACLRLLLLDKSPAGLRPRTGFQFYIILAPQAFQ